MSTLTTEPRAIATSDDRDAWLEARRGGITATEAGKLLVGSSQELRKMTIEKVTGTSVDLTGNKYIDRGNEREPIIAEWVERRFDIAPNRALFAGANPRHLATPDGISVVWPTERYLSEIKTSKHDLTAGLTLDGTRLVKDSKLRASRLWTSGYYGQTQWQMLVMGAEAVLFVAEQHDDNWPNPAPVTPEPRWFWIMRDEEVIAELVERASAKLAEIDAQRATGLAPVGDMPSEIAQLSHELLAARDAEAVAKARKDAAWSKLQELLLDGDDTSFENVEARVTVSTTKSAKRVVDTAGMKAKAPALVAKYEALVERFTTTQTVESKRLTVTAKKGD